jgi:hypothetical protein
MSMAGLDEEEDVFAPVMQSSKRRSIWLGVNLVTVFIAVFLAKIKLTTIAKAMTMLSNMSANHKCVATPITNAQIKPFNFSLQITKFAFLLHGFLKKYFKTFIL